MDNEMLTYLAFLLGGGGSGSFIETGVVATALEDEPATFVQGAGDDVAVIFPSPPESLVELFWAHWGEPIEVRFADDGIVRSLSYDNTQYYYTGDDTLLVFDEMQLAIVDSTGNHSYGDSTTVTVNFVGETVTENYQQGFDTALAQHQFATQETTQLITPDYYEFVIPSGYSYSQTDAFDFEIPETTTTITLTLGGDEIPLYPPEEGYSWYNQDGSIILRYGGEGYRIRDSRDLPVTGEIPVALVANQVVVDPNFKAAFDICVSLMSGGEQ